MHLSKWIRCEYTFIFVSVSVEFPVSSYTFTEAQCTTYTTHHIDQLNQVNFNISTPLPSPNKLDLIDKREALCCQSTEHWLDSVLCLFQHTNLVGHHFIDGKINFIDSKWQSKHINQIYRNFIKEILSYFKFYYEWQVYTLCWCVGRLASTQQWQFGNINSAELLMTQLLTWAVQEF